MLALLFPALSIVACRSPVLHSADRPVVGIQTTKGRELGVTTEDGLLFLGRTASEGPAKALYFLGSAALIEAGDIHKLGGSIFELRLDVQLPTVPISFEPLQVGENLLMIGLDGEDEWQFSVSPVKNDVIFGSVLTYPSGFERKPEYVGAGVFRSTSRGYVLVGLLKGAALFDSGERYLLLAGLTELKRALMTPRKAVIERRVIYRPDGLRREARR